MSENLRESLARTLDEAEWGWLEPHAARGALLLVARELELIEVAMAMARDDAASLQVWLTRKQVGRPDREQLDAWKVTPQRRFMSVIVQPYVLIQEIVLS
jgi:hypothetical protein